MYYKLKMTTGFAMPTLIISITRYKLALHTEIVEVKDPFVLSKKWYAKNTMYLHSMFSLNLHYSTTSI